MGLGPIPYSAIRSYADEHNIVSRDEFDFFLGVLQAVDAEYLAIMNEKSKEKSEMVPISDVAEQHLLFDRLKARAGAAATTPKKQR